MTTAGDDGRRANHLKHRDEGDSMRRKKILLAAGCALAMLWVGMPPATAERGAMHQPVTGEVTSKIDHRCSGTPDTHDGIDIGAPQGRAVYAAYGGWVEFRGNRSDGYGNQIVIRHRHNYWTRYAHLSTFNADATVGAWVNRGQRIGAVGATGGNYNPHLHFEVRRDSAWGAVHRDLNQGYTCYTPVNAKERIDAPFPDLPA